MALTANRLPLFVLLLVAVLFMLGRGVMDGYAVFLLPISEELGLSRTSLSTVYSITFMVWGFSGPIVGQLFDRFGPAVVYGAGISLIALGQFLAGQADGLLHFIIGIGFCVGLGVACLGNVVAAGMLRAWFSGRINTALAVAHAAGIGGVLFWAPFCQYMIDLVGWRDGFTVIAGVVTCFLPLCAVIWFLEAGRRLSDRKAADDRQTETVTSAHPEAGVGLYQALRDPGFWGMAWVFSVTGIGMHSIVLQIPSMLVEVGYSPQVAAQAFGACGFMAPAGMLIFGWLGDHFGRRRLVLISYGFSVVGAGFAVALALEKSLLFMVLFIVLFGSSFGSRGPIISAMATRFFAGAQFGRIYGWLTIFMGLGGAVGAATGGLWRDLSGSYSLGMMISLVMLAAGSLPFIFVKRMAQG